MQQSVFTCQVFHPVCLNATVNNKIEIKESPLCHQACAIAYHRLCNKSIQTLRAVNKLKLMCPHIDLVNTRKLVLPDCDKYPRFLYMDRIENCQLHKVFGINFIYSLYRWL